MISVLQTVGETGVDVTHAYGAGGPGQTSGLSGCMVTCYQ